MRRTPVNQLGSIWDGSVQYRPSASPVWQERFDPDLRRLIDAGHCMGVVGRNSIFGGRKGAELAVLDARQAAREIVLGKGGWNLLDCMPSKDEMVDALIESPLYLRSYPMNGTPFTNRFVLIDVREHGFVISLSCGSAVKLGSEQEQPHTSWLRKMFENDELNLRSFSAKKWDRLSRDDLAVLTFRKYLSARFGEGEKRESLWIAEGDHGRWNFNEAEDLMMHMKGKAARAEAREIDRKRYRGWEDRTDTDFKNGSALFGAGISLPPGLYRYEDLNTHKTMIAIDEPDRAPAFKGLPEVFDDEDNPVYQAELVTLALSLFGPSMSISEVMEELLRRRYSTANLRSMGGQGATAYYGSDKRPATDWSRPTLNALSRAILNNLEFYRTGRLVVNIGSGREPVIVEGVFPASGRWASEEDFERIERWLASNARRRASVTWSWTQMPIEVNGMPAAFRPSGHRSDADVRWSIVAPDMDELRAVVPGSVPTVSDDLLTAAIIDGVLAANGQPLLPYVASVDAGHAVDAEALRSGIEAQIAECRKTAQQLRADMDERDPDTGERVRDGYLVNDMGKEYNKARELEETLIAQLESLGKPSAAATLNREGTPATQVGPLLTRLQNPQTSEYRSVLRRTIRDLKLTVAKEASVMGTTGYRNELTGVLLLASGSGSWQVPFGATFTTGPLGDLDERVAEAEKGMRTGRVTKFVPRSSTENAVLREMIHRLGFDSDKFALRTCYDADLLRLGMAVVSPPVNETRGPSLAELVTDPGLIASFDNVDALVRRIREIYVEGSRSIWLITDRTESLVATLIAEAAAPARLTAGADVADPRSFSGSARWVRARGHKPFLMSCVWCGSRWCSPMRFPEVTGYLCLDPSCRKDEAGVRWPNDYDRYIGSPQQWLKAGVDLAVPPGYTGSKEDLQAISERPDATARKRVLPRRKPEDLTRAERQAIVDDYLGPDPAVVIYKRWRMDYAVLLQVIDQEGVQRRANATRARPTAS